MEGVKKHPQPPFSQTRFSRILFLEAMNEISENSKWPDEQYISKIEMAHRMNVSTRTIEIWMHQQKVPFAKIGRTVRFHWGDVRELLSRQQHLNTPPETNISSGEHSRVRLQGLATLIRKRHRATASVATIIDTSVCN